MILGAGKRQETITIGNDNKAGFLAFEKLFDDDSATCATQPIAAEHIEDGFSCFIMVPGNHDPFSCCQPVGLDHERRGFPRQVADRSVGLFKHLVIARRYLVFFQKALGITFGTFQLR